MTFEDSIDHGEAIIDQLLDDVIALDDYRRQSIALGFSDAAAQCHVEDMIHELNELRISYDDPFLRPRPGQSTRTDRGAEVTTFRPTHRLIVPLADGTEYAESAVTAVAQ